MHRGNIKVRRSLNRCVQKENVENLDLNNITKERNNFSIPSLTMRPGKLLPHLQLNVDNKKQVNVKSKPHQDDQRKELRKISNTMVTTGFKTRPMKNVNLSPIVFDINDHDNVQLMRNYGQGFIDYLRADYRKQCHFLQKHSIVPALRARMIDWIMEVVASFRFNDSTLFYSIDLMDRYFTECHGTQGPEELHAIGVTAMFMASKMNEIYPLRIRTVFQKIVHRKLSETALRDKQASFLKCFNFCLKNSCSYDYMKLTIMQMRAENIITKRQMDDIDQMASYLLKTTIFQYGIVSQYSQIAISCSVILLSLHILNIQNQSIEKKMKSMWNIEVPTDCIRKIDKLLRNFEKMYPNLNNLKRFHRIDIPEYEAL